MGSGQAICFNFSHLGAIFLPILALEVHFWGQKWASKVNKTKDKLKELIFIEKKYLSFENQKSLKVRFLPTKKAV